MTASDMVTLGDIFLPDFDKNISMAQHLAIIFDNNNCIYDTIIGTNICPRLALKWTMNLATWNGTKVHYP